MNPKACGGAEVIEDEKKTEGDPGSVREWKNKLRGGLIEILKCKLKVTNMEKKTEGVLGVI